MMRTVVVAALASALVSAPASATTPGPAGETWAAHAYDYPAVALYGERGAAGVEVALTPADAGPVLRGRHDGGEIVDAGEPLMPGERVLATWERLGTGATLRVAVVDPLRRARNVTIPLRSADRRTTVAVAVDGALTIVRGTATTVSPVPPLGLGEPGGPAAPWSASTPQVAIRKALRSLLLRDPLPDLARYCASFDQQEAAAWAPDPTPDEWALRHPRSTCALALRALMFENDNSSPGPTTGRILSVRRVSSREAVALVRLRHRYTSTRDVLRRTVRMLLVRERPGAPWRITAEDALAEPWDPAAPGDFPGLESLGRLRQIRAMERRFDREARRYEAERRQAVERAARTIDPGADACPAGSGGEKDDALGDVRVGTLPAGRDPALVTVDVRSARLDWSAASPCLTMRFARPPGPRFHVRLTTRPSEWVELWVADGRAVLGASQRKGPKGWEDGPLPGARASLAGDTLVVRLPAGAVPTPSPATRWALTVAEPHPYAANDLLDEVGKPIPDGSPCYDPVEHRCG